MSVVPYSPELSAVQIASGIAQQIYPYAKKIAKFVPYAATRPKNMFNFPFVPKNKRSKRKIKGIPAGMRVIKAEKKAAKAVVKAEKKVAAKMSRMMSGVTRQSTGSLPRTKFAFSKAANKFSRNRPGAVTFTGHEFVAGVDGSAATNAQGSTLLSVVVNPLTIGSKRLRTFAGFFENFYFEDFKVKYIQGASTTVSGSMRGAWDMDPADSLGPSNAQKFLTVMSQPGSKAAEYFKPQTWVLPRTAGQTKYYTNATASSDVRLVNQAVWNLVVENPAAATSGALPTNLGNIMVYYRCTFWNPITEGNEITSDVSAYAPGGGTDARCPWGTIPVQQSNTGGSEFKVEIGTGGPNLGLNTVIWPGQIQAVLYSFYVHYDASKRDSLLPDLSINFGNCSPLVGATTPLTYAAGVNDGEVVIFSGIAVTLDSSVNAEITISADTTSTSGEAQSDAWFVLCPVALPVLAFRAKLGQEQRMRNLLAEFRRVARGLGVTLDDHQIDKQVLQSKRLLVAPEKKKLQKEDEKSDSSGDFTMVSLSSAKAGPRGDVAAAPSALNKPVKASSVK